MKRSSLIKIVTATIVTLIIAIGLNSILNISSFEKLYKSSLINKYQIITKTLKRQIETAVNLEKPIDHFYGMNKILTNLKNQEENIENLFITLPDGKIVYCTDQSLIGNKINLNPIPYFEENPDSAKNESYQSQVVASHSKYYIVLPVYYQLQKWVGSIYITFDKKVIERRMQRLIYSTLINMSIILAGTFLILILLIGIINKIDQKRRLANIKVHLTLKTKFIIATMFCLILSQSVYTYLNNQTFRDSYIDMTELNNTTLLNLVKNNIESILKKGIPLNKITKLELLFSDIMKSIPECREIVITDIDGNIEYRVSNMDLTDDRIDLSIIIEKPQLMNIEVSDGKFEHSTTLVGLEGDEGFAIIFTNADLINRQVFDLYLDSLTIIFVSLIFSFEVLLFFFLIMLGQSRRDRKILENGNLSDNTYKLIRSIAFIFYFADAIPLSFLPLFIKELYTKSPISFFGIGQDMMLGLPISSYMLGVAIFLPFAGYLLDRISSKKIFIFSTLLTLSSFILTAFSTNLVQLIIFRFIAGMGYGGIVICGQTFVIRHTDLNNRTSGFGELMSGFFGGNICAAAIGGLLASRLGYKGALLSGAFLSLGFILFILFRLKEESAVAAKEEDKRGRVNFKVIMKIFKNKSFVAALFFESIPAQITFIGFVFYICPLYLNSINISQSNIGRVLTGFGIAFIVLGPIVSKYADKFNNDRIFMIIGNLIVGLMLILFFFVEGVYMIILGIVAIGLGNAMLASTEASYISLMKEVKEIGASNVMSVYRSLERIGQITGPIIAGLLITLFRFNQSIGIIGVINIVGILLFMILSTNLRKS